MQEWIDSQGRLHQEWRDSEDRLHRDDDLPAAVWSNIKEWWIHGERHREGDLPAIKWERGCYSWYIHGKRHRDGGLPAMEWYNGTKEWFVHGERHRDGGSPAIECYIHPEKEWWFEGYKITQVFSQKIALRREKTLERALRLVKYQYLLPRLYHPDGERARKEAEETLRSIKGS